MDFSGCPRHLEMWAFFYCIPWRAIRSPLSKLKRRLDILVNLFRFFFRKLLSSTFAWFKVDLTDVQVQAWTGGTLPWGFLGPWCALADRPGPAAGRCASQQSW